MAEDELNSKVTSASSTKSGSVDSGQSSHTLIADDKLTVVSASSTPAVSTFQIRQHFISPSAIQLANSAVVLPVQGLPSQAAISQSVQIPKTGVPLLGASAVSGQFTFQAPVSQSSLQQVIPMSQSIPASSTIIGQQVALQKGHQVTLQRGQSVTLQRFQTKAQPITVQRFPAVLPIPASIQRNGASSSLGKVQLARQSVLQASNSQHLSTKSPTAISVGQNHASNLRLSCPIGQQLTVQRIVNPVVAQQNSGVASSQQIATNALSQAMAVSLHSESSPVGTATILSGQQITVQPRSAGTLISGPVTTPITLTVTSISPASPVISSSSSTVPVIAHTSTTQIQQQQTFIQRPGVVVSQPSVLRTGIPVVLPRSALTLGGRQQVLQGTLQRLIHRPLISQASNCGGQVTVQIPHVMGPIIKMPNYKQSATPASQTPCSTKENSCEKVSFQASNTISSTSGVTSTTTATVLSTTLASAQTTLAESSTSLSDQPTTAISSSISSSLNVSLTELKGTDQISLSCPENGHASTCITSSSVPLSKENVVATLNVEKNELKKEIISGSPASNISSENTVLSTSTQISEDKESTIETSNISILPNTLASLRNRNLNSSPNKDCNLQDENKQNPGVILTEGFIDSNLLDWDGKIGTLPGTEMKFKINEFGDLELLDEGDNETSSVKTETVEDNRVKVKEDEKIQGNVDDDNDDDDDDGDSDTAAADDDDGEKEASAVVNDPAELSEREDDPVCCCVYCGRYGYKSNFRTSGRFCSQTCAGKKNMHRKQLLMSRLIQGSKKKPKQISVLGEVDNAIPSEDSNGLDKSNCSFDWEKYLAETGATGAPKRLFKEPFPTARNGFKLGMRLEGVDPKHQALICVLSIAEIKGFRLRLHFDGYSECYDFWVNADSPFIFPVGWAEKNGKSLQPAKNMPISEFNWTSYLKETRAVAAPKHLFLNQPSSVTPSAFRVGMKLEARDQKHSDLYCVASVADSLGDRVLIHFDGWEDIYDFWCDINSPKIRPIGWCRQNHKKLSAPPDYGDAENFTWDNYLADTKSTAVPSRAFKPRGSVGFESGMKLEVTDKRNPILIRVATVKKVKNVRLLIHFDGWDNEYDYWIDDDNSDLHPPHWCAKTGHALQPPIGDKANLEKEDNSGGCPTFGCKGIGHIKGAKYTGHHSDFGCPYSAVNMSKDSCLVDRLGSSRSEEGGAVLMRHDYHGDIRRCPTPGCNGLGHVTGKFTSHHCVSGCPLAEKNIQKVKQEAEARPVGRPARGRKRKMFGFNGIGPPEKHIKTEHICGPGEEGSLFRASVHESVFQSMSGYSPVREQPLGWSDHTKLLPGVFSIDNSMVDKWSIEEVAEFIQTLTGNEEQAKRFREEEIDGDSFLLLQQSDLVNFLNIKLGPAVKIFNSIQVFRAGVEHL